MNSSTPVRRQPASHLLRRTSKQPAPTYGWHRGWNGNFGKSDKIGYSRKGSRRQRHMPRLCSEPSNRCPEKMSSPTGSVAESLPCLPNQTKEKELCPQVFQDLPLSIVSPLSSISSNLPSLFVNLDEEGICLHPRSGTPERQSTTTSELDAWERTELNPESYGSSGFLDTPGPLERFLAQDEFHESMNLDDQQNTNATILRLRALRANALRFRSILRTKRKLLRERQSAKVEADDAFMRYVREHMFALESHATFIRSDVLQKLFSAMEETRNIYGPLQEEYNEAEENLDDTEFELGMLEGRIHKTANPKEPNTSAGKATNDTSQLVPLPPGSFTDSSSEVEEEIHSLHSQLLSRLGDLDIATERLHGIKQEYEDLQSDQFSRLKVGLDLPKSLQSRLSGLPELQLALEKEIVEIESDVEKFHSDCLAAGVLFDGNDDDDDEDRVITEAGKDELRNGDGICTADDDADILHGITSRSDLSRQSFQIPKFDESNKGGQINH